MDTLLRLMREHLLLAGFLVLFIPVSAISVLALVWRFEHEVLWHGSWVFRNCGLPVEGENPACIGQYEMSFGNTGDHTEDVTIDWPLGLRDWSWDWRVLNLSADRQRANDPAFTCQKSSADTQCPIADFAPGTLLILTLRCLVCERTELLALDDERPSVKSPSARVIASDPRATLLFRRLSVFFFWL